MRPTFLVPLLLVAARAAAAGDPGAPLPRPDHVVIVVEENHAAGQVLGNADAPYINSLARAGANFTSSYGITHPSQPNYIALFCGSTKGVSNDDCPKTFPGANLGSQLLDTGLTFAGYSESMPTVGYPGCRSGGYYRKHNPWVDFTNLPSTVNLRFSDFPADFATLPTVAFVVPNQGNDMHDGSVRQGDDWLRRHVGPYVQWAATHNSLLILTWDEDDHSEGNRIATVFVGPMVRPGNYPRHIDHYAVLRAVEEMYGLEPLGSARRARRITEVWSGPSFTNPASAVGVVGSTFRLDLTTDASWPVAFATTSPLPDGLAFAGDSIAGMPTGPGTWIVEVTADAGLDGRGAQRLAIVVVRDGDGDGVEDEIETAAGTDPAVADAPPSAEALDVNRADVRLRFTAAGRDRVDVEGSFEVSPAFDPAGATVAADVAGIVRKFTLGADGRSARDPGGSLRLAVDAPGAAARRARFTLRFAGSLATSLADEGLTAAPSHRKPSALLVTILADGRSARAVVPVRYSAGTRGTGRASRED
jgi:acid phosphatase